eukprot:TRINITY_DN10910_c0_g1_i1.p1 TRINITY_DN10910_c0_g1~~TRINITY_DN10910_c0_g1_i1.p1  ORF type:complete len:307 (-),score=55.28 TRINITY_DN10910_c0_g1_i1:438-1358(-)
MAASRVRRGSSRHGEQAKVVGGVCLVGLVACAALFAFDATSFVAMRATPLTTTSHASVAPKVAAASYVGKATTASSPAFAACVMLVAAAAARSAFAGALSKSRSSSARAVVRCADATVASPVVMPEPVIPQPPSSPLVDLSEPVAMQLNAPVHYAPSPIVYNIACDVPMQTVASVAAPAEHTHAAAGAEPASATRSAFAGARAARVIGGVRHSASRSQGQNGSSKKSIRCYVAPKFPEVVPLTPVYDPSTLRSKLQAGLRVSSRVRKVFSRERKSTAACGAASSFTGVDLQSMYFSAKRLYPKHKL